MRVSSLDSEGRARWTCLAALSLPAALPPRISSDREDRGALGETVPVAPEVEIRDWIRDWNRATQEIRDWQPFEI